MATVYYCEFCGAPAGKADDAQKLVNWVHNVAKNVMRCDAHRRTSKMVKSCRTHDPLTGKANQ
jgi:hypothetical protein